MKAQLMIALFVAAAMAGCTDNDKNSNEPTFPGSEPTFNNTQPGAVTGLEFVAQLNGMEGDAWPSASGVWNFGNFIFASGLGTGFFIADVTDPTNPVMAWNATTHLDAANNTITSFSRDADVVAHPDGRVTLVLATQSNGMHVWDVTDPYNPVHASVVDNIGANHNIAVVPGTEYVFNAQSGGAGGTNELIDVSDPQNPVVLGSYGTHGCHDIAFFGNESSDKFRAYCAGIDRTEIWDLDGFNVTELGFGITLRGIVSFPENSPVIGNPAFDSSPTRTLHHLAVVNEDASVLIIGDEFNGGGSPGACIAYDEATGASQPLGALWFYDISNEDDPVLLSWLSAPFEEPGQPDPTTVTPTNPTRFVTGEVPNCTGHFGTFVPGEEKFVIAWYSAGVLLVDFADPAAPMIIDQYRPDGINTWDARVHNGYVFTGDITRGMDVLRLV